MHIEKLKNIQETLASAAEAQIYNLECVDAKELGEVIDIIKDIEETIYYCTVTKAMKGEEQHPEKEEKGYMYYTAPRREGHSVEWDAKTIEHPLGENMHRQKGAEPYYEKEFPNAFQDGREGRSPRARRMYMEAKETKQDKTTQMKELEKYVQELAQDMVEMVEDASPEERQYLSKKISALSTKIAQSNV